MSNTKIIFYGSTFFLVGFGALTLSGITMVTAKICIIGGLITVGVGIYRALNNPIQQPINFEEAEVIK